jgi:uncharacterized protein involved in exopolysaccharide biosynthesis
MAFQMGNLPVRVPTRKYQASGIELARNKRKDEGVKKAREMRKVSPTSSLWLMLFFGGVLVLAIVVTLIWHFFNFGKAL